MTTESELATRSIGYEPVGMVNGSSAYAIPLAGRYANYKQNMEVGVFTHGLHASRLSALARMQKHAADLGADGIVDVAFEVPTIPKDGKEIRFNATGTAVHARGDAVANPRDGSRDAPFTAAMSGAEFALLGRAGYVPTSIVMGVCVFHVGRRTLADTLRSAPQNTELTMITEALYESREAAMLRMQEEAKECGAHGVVGVRVQERTHAWGSRVIEFMAVGTAVDLVTDGHEEISPSLMLHLGAAQGNEKAPRHPRHA